MQCFLKNRYGFTLLELVITIAIIGLLAALGLSTYQGALPKARDAHRKQDLRQIQLALQAYYNDNGHYPDASTTSYGFTSNDPAPWIAALVPKYIRKLPVDPINNYPESGDPSQSFTYVYYSGTKTNCANTGDTSYYYLQAPLENTSDPLRGNAARLPLCTINTPGWFTLTNPQ